MKNIFFFALIYCCTAVAQSFRNVPQVYDQCLQPARVVMPAGILNASCQPYVIEPGESFGMFIELDQKDIKQVDLVSNAFAGLKYNNQTVTKLSLKDDGTQGDLKAGDNIFSISPLSLPANPMVYPGTWFLRYCDVTFIHTGNNTETQSIDLGFGERIIPTNTLLPAVKKLNDSVQYTDYVLNVTGTSALMDNRQSLTKAYYKYFPDDRDFLVRSTTYPSPGPDIPAANFFAVKNNVQGIYGNTAINPIFDRTTEYGSMTGKLLGYINMFFTYGGQATLLNHEVLHNFGVYLEPNLKISTNPHWAYTVFSSSGFGSGFQVKSFAKLTDTSYIIVPATSGVYNPLELYLMGMLPSDSIPFPIQSLLNGSFLTTTLQGNIIKATGVQEISKTLFFNAIAPRNPGVSTAQKSFKIGSIVLSDRLLSPKELSYYNEIMKENENKNQSASILAANGMNFFTATHKKGEFITRIANVSTPIHAVSIESPLRFYPNPINEKLKYSMGSSHDEWTYELNDFYGRTVKKGNLDGSDIDTRLLQAGAMVIRIADSQHREYVQKIIIYH